MTTNLTTKAGLTCMLHLIGVYDFRTPSFVGYTSAQYIGIRFLYCPGGLEGGVRVQGVSSCKASLEPRELTAFLEHLKIEAGIRLSAIESLLTKLLLPHLLNEHKIYFLIFQTLYEYGVGS